MSAVCCTGQGISGSTRISILRYPKQASISSLEMEIGYTYPWIGSFRSFFTFQVHDSSSEDVAPSSSTVSPKNSCKSIGSSGIESNGAIAPKPGSMLVPKVVASTCVDSPSESVNSRSVSVLITSLSDI